tara:strand:+ start:6785 stop:7468 length:684 start_codon:yes stop_codon:yes gene_type:complete
MSSNALAIYLDGPMQSWGVASRFQHRESESLPTKSGVLGLVAAAMGIDKHATDEAEQLKPLAALRFSVFRAFPENGKRPHQRLSDFHTVGGGYDKTDPRGRLSMPHKASGGPFGTVITHRTYLTDARFIAVLEGDAAVLAHCASALENPHWGVWFGRKTCLPAAPLGPTLGRTCQEVVETLATKTGVTLGEGQIQPESLQDDAWFLPDSPVSYGKREYNSRPVKGSE